MHVEFFSVLCSEMHLCIRWKISKKRQFFEAPLGQALIQNFPVIEKKKIIYKLTWRYSFLSP